VRRDFYPARGPRRSRMRPCCRPGPLQPPPSGFGRSPKIAAHAMFSSILISPSRARMAQRLTPAARAIRARQRGIDQRGRSCPGMHNRRGVVQRSRHRAGAFEKHRQLMTQQVWISGSEPCEARFVTRSTHRSGGPHPRSRRTEPVKISRTGVKTSLRVWPISYQTRTLGL
jgi:hypothetical protein